MELTEQQAIDRGEAARRILNDPIVESTLRDMEQDIMEAWAKNPIMDTQGAAELARLVKTHRKFKSMLETYINRGRYTAAQMRQASEEKESLMNRIGRKMFNG